MVSAGDTRADLFDYALFAGTLIACGFFFFEGGWGGIGGALIGAVFGYLRPLNPHARWGSAFKAAFAVAWAGIMMGGVVAVAA